MKIKLGSKIGLTYLLILFSAMAVLGYLIISDIKQSFIGERKNVLFSYANIIAEKAAPYLHEQNTAYINFLAEDFGENIGHRILILDTAGTIIGDSSGASRGQHLSTPVVTASLQGESSAQTNYYPEYGNLLYLAVPVASSQQIIGAVFISADINDIQTRLNQTRNRLLAAALASGILAILLSLPLARIIITVPIGKLTRAAQKMSAGEYGYQVQIKSRDELEQLANSFNEMSEKIRQEDDIRRQFIANASHELKSPVAALKVLVESLLIKHPESKEETREFLFDIDGQLDRLSRLVNDLLLLSKIEKNTVSLNLEPVAIGQLLTEVKDNLLPLAANKEIEIKVKVQENITWPADREMLYRAVYNLADNAIKFSSLNKQVLLNCNVNKNILVISVFDQGMGISPEHLEKIFDRFYRVNKARERTTGGTGLGLAIVKEIITLHGGTVSAKSVPAHGSEFLITLPDPKQMS
ncbi:cell wall metabolism sensor histidine kinase WalK [Dehalobacter sp. DCM]|uniref:sensor histidine kinase n=1 Tax=Dehalobacter sp. DCM TaxID=2907827 RepID=UPI0030820B88|nr:cell wall metabolism sensor histidine kinase WalK [Dehalobacter sp. DCM]